MKIVGALLLTAAFAACGGDRPAGPGGSTRPTITSRSWSYRYVDTLGYAEGLDSVRGTLALSRESDTLWITAPSDVVGFFWSTDAAARKFVALIWPAGGTFVARTVQSGDTLRVTAANVQAFAALGYYVLVPDGVDFAWLRARALDSLELRIAYR